MITGNLAELFKKMVIKNHDEIAVEYRLRRNERYRTITWGHLNTIVLEIAYALIELGFKPGGKVAILSDTRYEWAVCDLGILSAGGVVVPIYPSLPSETVSFIINDSECEIVIVEDKGQLQKIRSQWENLPSIKYAIVIEDLGDIPEHDEKIITLKRLKDIGKLSFSKEPYLIDNLIPIIKKTDLATIIYTSGTTGNPKGVMLTHKNILAVLDDLPKVLPLKHSDKFLSFLPLSHVFERVGGLHYAISIGTPTVYCPGMEQIGPALKDSGATMMLVVPRVLEKMHSKIMSGVKILPESKRKMFEKALSIGLRVVRLRNRRKSVPLIEQIMFFLADRFIFSSLRKKIAPTLKYFISGGAPLSMDIAEFFEVIGISVLEGYGLTETSAPATVNSPNNKKIGTVGKVLPSIQIKIADDGEILFKGDSIFVGYYKNEEANAEVFENGWFHTGDIGEIDGEGFLKITDRKKDIIVNSAGKKIAPQNLENILKTSHFISNVVVVGDKRKYMSALITLDTNSIMAYIHDNKICENGEINNLNSLVKNPGVIKLIEEEIKVKLSDYADFEQIRKFAILPNDFSIESGEITPTLKVKRKFVQEKYKGLIDSMYPTE